MRDEDRHPRGDFGPPRSKGGITFTKLFVILAGIFVFVVLAVWLWPDSWKSNIKDVSYGQAAGQAQGAPTGTPTATPTTTTHNGGGGTQPTPPPPTSTPPSNGGPDDMLADSERLAGGPCKGAAVERMKYHVVGLSKEDGRIKVGLWCSDELNADHAKVLPGFQAALQLHGIHNVSEVLSNADLHHLRYWYPGRVTVRIKDGTTLHTLIDPRVITLDGTPDFCAPYKQDTPKDVSQFERYLYEICKQDLALKPTNVLNTIATVGNWVNRPEFEGERNYTRAELKRLREAIEAANKPLPPTEVARVLNNPHSQEQKYEPTPPTK